MALTLPLEIIYHIMEELAAPDLPLAYNFQPFARQTLVSFTSAGRATHGFANRLLLSRVCIESERSLFRFMNITPLELSYVGALYIDLERTKLNHPRGSDSTQPLSIHEQSKRAVLIAKITDCLCHLLSSVHNLGRLVLYLSRDFSTDAIALYPGHDAPRRFWPRLRSAFAQVLPHLTELHLNIPLGSSFVVEGFEYDWGRLRRLSCWDGSSQPRRPCMPALEHLAIFCLDSTPRHPELFFTGLISLRKVLIILENNPFTLEAYACHYYRELVERASRFDNVVEIFLLDWSYHQNEETGLCERDALRVVNSGEVWYPDPKDVVVPDGPNWY